MTLSVSGLSKVTDPQFFRENTIDSLEKENDDLRDKLSKLKSHYLKLYEFAKKNNIELKPRNVPMGSVESS